MTPSGPIKTKAPNGGIFASNWEDITRFDAAIHAAADPLAWPIERIRAHIVIESGGDPKAHQINRQNGDSYGLLQVVPYGVGWQGWYPLVMQKAGLSNLSSQKQVVNALYDPAINIAVGVQILEGFYQQYGKDADKASSAFFLGNPNWTGGDTVNGTSGAQYKKTLSGLIDEQKAFAPVDPIRVIVGGNYPPITYGFLSDGGINSYRFVVGHGGTKSTQHSGVDVGVVHGTQLYSPVGGVVDCVGGAGTPRWGQACGAYNDDMYGGVGNITILLDSGHKLTLGHCTRSLVSPGQRVVAGQKVGISGGSNGDHVHVETSIYAPERVNRAIQLNGGDYFLVEPIAALQAAMGSVAPVTFPDPLPVPQATEFDVSITVTALQDGIPVLQRAAMDAPRTKPDLKQGDTFEAVYQVVGNDTHIYWITSLGNRVPVEHTSAAGWAGFGQELTPVIDVDYIMKEMDALRADVSKHLINIGSSLKIM